MFWPSITIFPMVKYPLFERFYSSLSILQKTFTTSIISTRLTAPGSPRMNISLHFDMASTAVNSNSNDVPYPTFGYGTYGTHSNFRSLLLQLSNSLTRKELQELKFLCGDVVPRGRLETINHGFELFEALEHLNKLSVRDRDFLASKLIAVNRTDLRNQLLEIEG